MQPFELHEVSSVFRVTALVNAAYFQRIFSSPESLTTFGK